MATTTKTFKDAIPVSLSYAPLSALSYSEPYTETGDGLGLYKSFVAEYFQDVCVTKNDFLFLTRIVSVDDIFVSKKYTTRFVTGSLSPQSLAETFVSLRSNGTLGIGSSNDKANVLFRPLSNGLYELFVDGKYIQIENEKPYRLIASEISVLDEQLQFQQFYIDFVDGTHLTIQAQTPEGLRFIALGQNGTFGACGVNLGQQLINPYVFEVTAGFVTATNEVLPNDYVVAYFNNYQLKTLNNTTDVKATEEQPTNHLVAVHASHNSRLDTNLTRLKTTFDIRGSAPTILSE